MGRFTECRSAPELRICLRAAPLQRALARHGARDGWVLDDHRNPLAIDPFILGARPNAHIEILLARSAQCWRDPRAGETPVDSNAGWRPLLATDRTLPTSLGQLSPRWPRSRRRNTAVPGHDVGG